MTSPPVLEFTDTFKPSVVFPIIGFGIVGVFLRFLVNNLFKFIFNIDAFYSTLVINILGSFLIAVLYVLATYTTHLSQYWSLVIMTGLLGGFTTFSGYCLDTIKLALNSQWGLAVLNGLVQPIASIFVVAVVVYTGQHYNKTTE